MFNCKRLNLQIILKYRIPGFIRSKLKITFSENHPHVFLRKPEICRLNFVSSWHVILVRPSRPLVCWICYTVIRLWEVPKITQVMQFSFHTLLKAVTSFKLTESFSNRALEMVYVIKEA